MIKKGCVLAVATCHFDTFTCKRHLNVLIASINPLIYAEICHFRPFWESKGKLWMPTILIPYMQAIVSRKMFIDAFDQFLDVSGTLLLKYGIGAKEKLWLPLLNRRYYVTSEVRFHCFYECSTLTILSIGTLYVVPLLRYRVSIFKR